MLVVLKLSAEGNFIWKSNKNGGHLDTFIKLWFICRMEKTGKCSSERVSYTAHMLRPLDTNELTNSMDQSPSWKADSHLASQEIPHILWNPQVHYRVHKSPKQVTVLSHMHPVHTFPLYFRKIRSNIMTHLCLGLLSVLFPPVLSTKMYAILISPLRATRLILDLITLVIFGEAT